MFVVLQHGIFGFAPFDIPSIPHTFEYFRGVAELFHDRGYDAFAAQVDPVGSVVLRARRLRERIGHWLATDPVGQTHRGEPCVIVAHSMGGLDARQMLLAKPEDGGPLPFRVAALVTIATPHRGSPVADVVIDVAKFRPSLNLLRATALGVDDLMGLHVPGFGLHPIKIPLGLTGSLLQDLHDLREQLLDDGEKQLLGRLDALGVNGNALVALDFIRPGGVDAVSNLTTAFCTKFDADTPDADGVRYYSVSTNCRGRVPPVFDLSFRIVDAVDGDNDGVVSVRSAVHGTDLGVWPFDHLTAVNMPGLPGTGPGVAAQVLAKYGELIDRLKGDGVLP